MSEQPAANPIPLSAFPPAVQRSIDPKSPLPVRMMAAKGLLACPPKDLLTALYVLTFDPDRTVVETARTSALKLQDKVLNALRDEGMVPETLDFYADMLVEHPQAVEMLVLNAVTWDSTIARLVRTASDAIVEIVAQNQLRLLRYEEIVRAIIANPNARPATKDTVLDFCVRSGLTLDDMPEYVQARRRIFGAEPEVAAHIEEAEQNTVEKVIQEFGEQVTNEEAEVEETKRLTFTQRVMKMSVSQKIKLATLGNKEARTLLLRDSNKLVAMAAVSSPRITQGEGIALSNSRTLLEEVMRYVIRNKDWLKLYQVKANLVNNPKCPVPTSIKLLDALHPNELKAVARNKNIAAVLQTMAKQRLQAKEK